MLQARFTAAMAPDGVLRIVDTDAGQQCKKSEKVLQWDTAPAPELPASFVALATDEVQLPEGRTEIASLNLGPGQYQVTAKVFLFSPSSQFVPGSGVACQLTPSNPDGTPGDPGAPPADPGLLSLAAAGEPGSAGTIALGVSQVLTQPGSAVLDCANANTPCAGHGAFGAFGKDFNFAGGADGQQTGFNNSSLCGNPQGSAADPTSP
jgi:hypothetical protein